MVTSVSADGQISRFLNGLGRAPWVTFFLVALGPVLALATFLILGPLDQGGDSRALRGIILADLVYVLGVAALVMQRIAQMIAARRAHSAGSRLHLRLTGIFTLVALIPTVLVAVFATLSVNFGLEGWFSDRVQRVVGASLSAAVAYEDEKRVNLTVDARAMADALDQTRAGTVFVSDGDLRQYLTQAQLGIQRGLRDAYVVDGTGALRIRGDRSYLFDFEPPSPEDLIRASNGEAVIIEDWENSEFRALLALPNFVDRFLYISREVDGQILTLLDETQETIGLYQQLESERGGLLFQFGLFYLGFAVILILAAIWLGLWIAGQLSRPIGQLAGAASSVGAGDFTAKVPISNSDDEIAMLGRSFNQMTTQLAAQREALLTNTQQIEEQRRLFDSVLGSVTAGVIGVDEGATVDFLNRSARELLTLGGDDGTGSTLISIAPEFHDLFEKLSKSGLNSVQEEVRLSRNERTETLLVRMARRKDSTDLSEGTVIVFDDVTDLVSAQRMAAWGDVARRIAHEIKNPLTPIQLSAERVKRKFSRLLSDEDAEALSDLTGVIVRQTDDLRRIVDEFSKFARMPEPERRRVDFVQVIQDAVTLQEAGQPDVHFSVVLPDAPLIMDLDSTMITQALTNLIKNAGEAIETRVEKTGFDVKGEVAISLLSTEDSVCLSITDNGIGLPEDPSKLFEPYVTTRDKGTGLGLPIVKKIIEEHDGVLRMVRAAQPDETGHYGAQVVITFPRIAIRTEYGAIRAEPLIRETVDE